MEKQEGGKWSGEGRGSGGVWLEERKEARDWRRETGGARGISKKVWGGEVMDA